MGVYGLNECTLTHIASNNKEIFYISQVGRVDEHELFSDLGGGNGGHLAIRPTFNLESLVTYASGTVTSSDSIRINL